MQRPRHLLFCLVLAGGLLAAVVVAGSGAPPKSCNTGLLALHISVALYTRVNPIAAAEHAVESCAVVRSGVDSSLAATGDVAPCLCFLNEWINFLYTPLCIEDVPETVYAACGGQHVKQAQLLAARCQWIIHPPPPPSPSPSDNKDKGGAIPRINAVSTIL